MTYAIANNSELRHFGILGQKWGIRRFQNYDGTYTEAGKERYYDKKGYLTKEGYKKYAVRRTLDDLPAKTIPSGTKLYRIAKSGEEATDKGSVYVYQQQDLANIRSITPALAKWNSAKIPDMKESSYSTTKDLKIPSQKEANDVMLHVLDSEDMLKKVSLFSFNEYASNTGMTKLKTTKKFLEGIDDSDDESFMKTATEKYKDSIGFIYTLMGIDKNTSEAQEHITHDAESNAKFLMDGRNIFRKKLETVKDTKMSDIGDIPQSTVEEVNFFLSNSVAGLDDFRDKTIKELSKRGYNAMYDNNMINAGTINLQEAHEPLLIFDSSTLEKTGETKLSTKDIAKSMVDYQNYRRNVEKDAKNQGLSHS